MCGFAGMAFRRAGAPRDAEAVVRRMASTLAHRGPDSDGRIDAPFADVRFKRLSIIDLSTGDQPVSNESGSLQMLMNGEIYNFRELRKELEAAGHRFRGHSDTEVLPHLYEEWGLDFAKRLNGMFTICVADLERRRLVLCRDRLGIKPLFYAERPEGLFFGSELKALLVSGAVPRALDPGQVLAFLNLFYCPGADTLVQGVHRLQPGELLEWTGEGPARLHTWWDLAEETRERAEPCDAARLDALLQDAVDLELAADVPVGVSLSGGLDSSLMAFYASRSERSDVKAFTIAFEETPSEELACASLVARQLGLDHEVLSASAGDFLAEGAAALWYADEPVADPAFFSALKVAEAASKRVKVLLSGTGGDELFAGYGRYQLTRKRRALAFALRRSPLAGWLFSALGRGDELRALRDYAEDRAPWHAEAMSHLSRADRARLAAALPGSRSPTGAIESAFARARHLAPLDQQLYADTVTYLRDQLLPLTDRSTMGVSIEGRVPYLDHRVVEAAFALPREAKLAGGREGKAVLRRLAAGRIPERVLRREKLGFPNPVTSWFSGALGEALPRIFARPGGFAATFLPPDWIAERTGSRELRLRHWEPVYAALVLQVWHRLFIEDLWERPPEVDLLALFDQERKASKR